MIAAVCGDMLLVHEGAKPPQSPSNRPHPGARRPRNFIVQRTAAGRDPLGSHRTILTIRIEGLICSVGLPPKAMPVSKLEPVAVLCLAFDVRFGSEADILACVRDVRFTPKSGHFPRGPICPLSAKSGHRDLDERDDWKGATGLDCCHFLFTNSGY
jgi:hypothetical protein